MNKNLEPNQKAMARFFELLTQDYDLDEVIEIRCLKELLGPNTTRFAVHAIDDAVEHVVQMNKTHNIYCVVNPVPQGVPKAAKDNDIKRAFLLSWMWMRGAQLIEQGRVTCFQKNLKWSPALSRTSAITFIIGLMNQ